MDQISKNTTQEPGGKPREKRRSVKSWLKIPAVIALVLVAGTATMLWKGGTGSRGTYVTPGVRIIDGDGLIVRGTEYRLFGIDAPESGQTCKDRERQRWDCGDATARALAEKIRSGQAEVHCFPRTQDRYGRSIAICYQGPVDLNEWMVREGHAVAYRRHTATYIPAETEARKEQKGLWDGSFVKPEDWRQGTRL